MRLTVEAERDERQIFKSHYPIKRRQDFIRVKRRKLEHTIERRTESIAATTIDGQPDNLTLSDAELAFVTDDWERRISYDEPRSPDKPPSKFIPYINQELWEGEWLRSISSLAEVDSASRETPPILHAKVLLNMNDPDILLERASRRRPSDSRKRGGMLSKFNISNDAAYDAINDNMQSRVRSSAATLNIEHSGLAIRLQHPFYKTKLSKTDARAFHRPSFTVKVDHEIHLSKMRSRKRKEDKGKDIATILAHLG